MSALSSENSIPMLEITNWPQPVTFRGNAFYIAGNGLREFPKLEIDRERKFHRMRGNLLPTVEI